MTEGLMLIVVFLNLSSSLFVVVVVRRRRCSLSSLFVVVVSYRCCSLSLFAISLADIRQRFWKASISGSRISSATAAWTSQCEMGPVGASKSLSMEAGGWRGYGFVLLSRRRVHKKTSRLSIRTPSQPAGNLQLPGYLGGGREIEPKNLCQKKQITSFFGTDFSNSESYQNFWAR